VAGRSEEVSASGFNLRLLARNRVFAKLLLIFAMLSMLQMLCRAQATTGNLRRPFVLVLHSYSPSPRDNSLQDGINQELVGPARIDLYVDFMDSRKIEAPEFLDELRQLLVIKYRHIKFDLVIVCDNNAYQFALHHRQELWPGVPIVFCGVKELRPQEFAGQKDFTGISENADLTAFVASFPVIVPGLRKLLIIRDDSPYAHDIQPHLLNALNATIPAVKFEFLENLSAEELAARLDRAEPGTAVFYISFWREKNGRFLNANEDKRILMRARVPVFSIHEDHVGNGALGSCFTDAEAQGAAAGKIAFKILSGIPAGTIPAVVGPPRRIRFDYPTMQRFGVSRAALPPGSQIANEPFSFYREYRRLVWATLGIITLLSTLVVLLVTNVMQRRRVEEQLRVSERNHREIFNATSDAIFIHEVPDGRLLDVNQAMLKMYGYDTRAEAISSSAFSMNMGEPPYSHAEAMAWMARAMVQGEQVFEWLAIRKSGERFWVEVALRRTSIGGQDRILASVRDISERRKAFEQFQRLAKEQRTILHTASAGICFVRNRKLEWVNPALIAMSGYEPSEVQGADTALIYAHPEDYQTIGQEAYAQFAKGAIYRNEMQMRRKDGSRLWCEIAGQAINSQNLDEGSIWSLLDIAERKRAEEELRWKTAFLEAQVDSALDGILVVDSQGKQILRNQQMDKLWKLPPQIAESKDDAAQFQFVASQAKNPKEFTEKIDYLNSHPNEVSRNEIDLIDGTTLDCYSSPVRDKTGKYYGRIWTFRDITQRRTLEAQFRQAQKMEGIGQLAAGVAHDFNNIMAVIQLQANLLKIEEGLSHQQLESASEIEKAAERAANLTRQLLLFSRKQTMQARNLDLNQSINDITKMLRRTLGDHIQVQLKFSLEPLFIRADANMMDQVLMNLAVNAHDAMPQGGQLIIETSAVEFDESICGQLAQARPGSFVCLSVGDTGCGISPENLPRIFEPFFTTKDVGKGTGLGLATTFGIVQQHEGWINVYSEVGRGTIFRIYLPRLAAESGQEPGQPELTAVCGGSETILLVEDEAALRGSMHKALAHLGYRVLESASGVEALKIWEQHRKEIDLLLTDMVMPGGMTGKDLAERLLDEKPELIVIYSSGYSIEVASGDLPLEEGVNFLIKPFRAHVLAQMVRDCLDRK
jgi:PAS domain S-box-containing protein